MRAGSPEVAHFQAWCGRCAANLLGDRERLLQRELLLVPEAVPQRLPFHHGHDIVEQPGRFAAVEQGENVGMPELGRGMDLGEEALGAHHEAELRPEHLEGHFATVLEIAGEVHRGHPALAQLPLEAVAVGESVPKLVRRIRQRMVSKGGAP